MMRRACSATFSRTVLPVSSVAMSAHIATSVSSCFAATPATCMWSHQQLRFNSNATRTRATAEGFTEPPPSEDPSSAEGTNQQGATTNPDGTPRYNPWEVMGLKEGASAHDIRLRYHELLKMYHPDHVPAGESGNMEELHKVEQAYQMITRAPTIDKRYKNLVSDTQQFYYRFLPQWMARNVDEMPRYWCWLRWKLSGIWFWPLMVFGMYVFGLMCSRFPHYAFILCGTFLMDLLLHTIIFPIVANLLLMKAIFSGDTYDLAWFHSPKGMLTRGLTY